PARRLPQRPSGGYLPEGAPAPPVGLEPAADFSPEEELFSFSSAVAPPEAVPSPDALELSSPPAEELPSPPASLEVEVELVVDLVAFVEVEVVCSALRSAFVSAGGVMSGVLLGTTSAFPLPPPQPASAEAPASARRSAMQARAITSRRADRARLHRAPPRAGRSLRAC